MVSCIEEKRHDELSHQARFAPQAHESKRLKNLMLILASEMQRFNRRLEQEPQNPQVYRQRDMTAFKLGDRAVSIADFNRAARLNPALVSYLWPRDLAHYYAERFADDAKQFDFRALAEAGFGPLLREHRSFIMRP
ncbi:hypothetical protein NKDENANG_02403 [Candidatus Entotheonellaceae bacterium PAL068K]